MSVLCRAACVLFVCIFLPMESHAQVFDPYQHFYKNFEILKEDDLLVYKVDLNEDGRHEVFISTTSERRNNAKAGRLWELYVSEGNSYFHYSDRSDLGVSLHVPKDVFRLRNGRLALIDYRASSAREGGFIAYYLGENNVLMMEDLGDIYAEPGEFSKKAEQVIAGRAEKVEGAIYESKKVTLPEVYSQSQIDHLKSYEEDFWSTHTFKKDPDRPGLGNKLVYRKSDGVFVGRLVAGEFVPIDREKEKTDKAISEEVDSSNSEVNKKDNAAPVPSGREERNNVLTPESNKDKFHVPYLLGALGAICLLLIAVFAIRKRKQ